MRDREAGFLRDAAIRRAHTGGVARGGARDCAGGFAAGPAGGARAGADSAAGEADRAGRGLAVTQPEKIRNNPEFRAQLEAIAPDAIVVVAYGRIIPPWMLALPRLGCINLHASLLPKYRGAAPIQWAVAMGETVTGNTTMLLEEGLDTGPILLQQQVEIGAEQTAADLFEVLAGWRAADGGDAGEIGGWEH